METKSKTSERKTLEEKFSLICVMQGHTEDFRRFYGDYTILKTNVSREEAEILRNEFVQKDKGKEFRSIKYYGAMPMHLVAWTSYYVKKEPLDYDELDKLARPPSIF